MVESRNRKADSREAKLKRWKSQREFPVEVAFFNDACSSGWHPGDTPAPDSARD